MHLPNKVTPAFNSNQNFYSTDPWLKWLARGLCAEYHSRRMVVINLINNLANFINFIIAGLFHGDYECGHTMGIDSTSFIAQLNVKSVINFFKGTSIIILNYIYKVLAINFEDRSEAHFVTIQRRQGFGFTERSWSRVRRLPRALSKNGKICVDRVSLLVTSNWNFFPKHFLQIRTEPALEHGRYYQHQDTTVSIVLYYVDTIIGLTLW